MHVQTGALPYIRRQFKAVKLLARLVIKGQLYEDGWFRSLREGRCVDGLGRPIPWLVYSAVDFISERIDKTMRVFEYGCGSSTLWWARRSLDVTCYEHESSWYESVKQHVPSNVTIHHVPLVYGGDYCKGCMTTGGGYDLIVIDGRDRINCAKLSPQALTPRGVVIWDNTERDSYQEGYDFLKEQGFKMLTFTGLLPLVSDKQKTSIFYRADNCLGL